MNKNLEILDQKEKNTQGRRKQKCDEKFNRNKVIINRKLSHVHVNFCNSEKQQLCRKTEIDNTLLEPKAKSGHNRH